MKTIRYVRKDGLSERIAGSDDNCCTELNNERRILGRNLPRRPRPTCSHSQCLSGFPTPGVHSGSAAGHCVANEMPASTTANTIRIWPTRSLVGVTDTLHRDGRVAGLRSVLAPSGADRRCPSAASCHHFAWIPVNFGIRRSGQPCPVGSFLISLPLRPICPTGTTDRLRWQHQQRSPALTGLRVTRR